MSNKIAVLKREEGIGRPLDLSHLGEYEMRLGYAEEAERILELYSEVPYYSQNV